MLLDLIYLFITLFITLIIYPFWIKFLYKFRLGQKERSDGPQSHLKKDGTPTMGGFVFILTASIVTFMFNRSRTQTLFPIFVASLAGLFGLLEDFSSVYRKSGLPGFFEYYFLHKLKFLGKVNISEKLNFAKFRFLLIPWKVFKELSRIVGSGSETGIQTYQKFLMQGFIAGFVAFWVYFKLGWDYIWFPLIGDVHLGPLYPLFVFFMFMAVLNFVAFTDGLDGLAGGLSIIALSAYWVIASQLEYNSLTSLCATLIGALLPFMYFNVFPARIFMGNVGSHVLGAVLAILALVMHREVVILLICGVFLIDGASSPLQQLSVKLTRKRIFRMAPLHHHFEMLGWPESKVTERFWLLGAFLAFAGIFVALL